MIQRQTWMTGALAVLMLAGSAVPVLAECPADMHPMFGCSVIERGAMVRMCYGDGRIHYSYSVDGVTELEFTGSAWGVIKSHVKGIDGTAYASAVGHGNTYYAIFVDRDLMQLDLGDPPARSPNPAVVQVYESQDALVDYTNDRPIARRVCYPPTIDIDNHYFGPG